VRSFEDAPVTGQFIRSHNPDLWCDRFEIEVKTLVRRDFPLRYFGAHRPFVRAGATVRAWTDGSGRPVPKAFAEGSDKRLLRALPARGARRFATLNHYALRSLESYMVKIDRGDVNRENRAFDVNYWQERNDAAVEGSGMLRHMPALRAEIAGLKALPGVGALHERAVAWHRTRTAELLREPGLRALADALQAAPALPPQEIALMHRLGIALS
jgi:hypothetical protein